MALTTKQINIILSIIIVVFSITLIVLVSYYSTRSEKQAITQTEQKWTNLPSPNSPLYFSSLDSSSEDPPPPVVPQKTVMTYEQTATSNSITDEYNPSWFDQWFNPDKVKDEKAWRKTLG